MGSSIARIDTSHGTLPGSLSPTSEQSQEALSPAQTSRRACVAKVAKLTANVLFCGGLLGILGVSGCIVKSADLLPVIKTVTTPQRIIEGVKVGAFALGDSACKIIQNPRYYAVLIGSGAACAAGAVGKLACALLNCCCSRKELNKKD